ncbi:hypothetical protein ANCDUO_19383 [Ancylostoma duodenale]|uniref:Uncharacterized protein n=1 Tax=Ancylostoma duodenale TaxID=51022 RepID=A0A0C2C2M1_9BILA|nr:hypothetical protein ANCDUO_19383 [Ancylostoma duodenale]
MTLTTGALSSSELHLFVESKEEKLARNWTCSPAVPGDPPPRTEEEPDRAPLEISRNDLDSAWISAPTIAGQLHPTQT